MGSKGQHVPDNSVSERRLRPIYDWLDIGNNKKALQECEKVLKKTPGLQCAKALKALTLHRLGKETEAEGILGALAAESPTDDATLQAMTLCYRELQQLEKICKLYETAVKLDPTNEELLTHLFMSYARIFDFKSQQKTAMTLYKHKPKTPYYCWAVMSIILQATRGEGLKDPQKRKLLLSLAERMMSKLILEGKLDAEQEVQLYVMILELQDKFEEVLKVLESPLGGSLACSNLPQLKLKFLMELGRWKEVNLICKGILEDCVDRWDIWKEYVNSSLQLFFTASNNHNHDGEGLQGDDLEAVDDSPEKCHEFICRIVENGADNGFLLRGPYLARFELCKKLIHHQADPGDILGEPIELFIEYFRKFGHKPCCVSDLKLYLTLLDQPKKSELASRLIKDVGINATSVPKSEQQMQRHLCSLQISRLCGCHRNLTGDHQRALVTAFSLHYEHGYQTYGTNLLSTDLGPSDPYALLAGHVLYDLSLNEKTAEPLVAAIVLLENVLKNSPSNFHAKLLCVRLYHTVGGTIGAQNMYNSLDCKHLQLDSLGFVHCARLPTTGMFSLCANLFDVTLKFFSSNYKDSSDHISFSYKYGSFIKLDEFMDFRERLNNSMHYTTVAVDRIILSLIECTTFDGLFNIDISPKDNKIEWDSLRDNQDLSVYVSWDPERAITSPENSEEIRTLTRQNLLFLKLRTFPIQAFASSIQIIKSSDGVRSKHIDQLKLTLKEWEEAWKGRGQHEPISQLQVTMPLPSRLHVALETPHYEILGGLFTFFLDVLEERGVASISFGDLMEGVKKRVGLEEGLVERRQTIEYFVNVVEILSLSTLICLLCNDVIKARKGRKKVNDGCAREMVNKVGTCLRECCEEYHEEVGKWAGKGVESDLRGILEGMNLTGEGKSVWGTITDSYENACKEIQGVLKNKVKMLNCLA